MKALFILLLTASAIVAKPIEFILEYEKGEEANYIEQTTQAFSQRLATDRSLNDQFTKFQRPPPEGRDGRYEADPKIQAFMLSESENAAFTDSGGEKIFEKTFALYYRFDTGEHRGRRTASGFFAIFHVKGNLKYGPRKGTEFELGKTEVTAEFQGFNRTVKAPEPAENGQHASPSNGDKPSK